MKNSYFYDIEVLPNFFSVIFVPITLEDNIVNKYINADINNDENGKIDALKDFKYKKFIIYNETNNIEILINFINKNVSLLIGFNNHKYDDIVLDFIINIKRRDNTEKLTTEIYRISQDIISLFNKFGNNYNYRKENGIYKSNSYKSIDLMRMHYLDVKRISLKQISIVLKWYKVEEYNPPPITNEESNKFYNGNFPNLEWYERYVSDNHVSKILEYNLNDVLITRKLWFSELGEFKQRAEATTKYKLNLWSASRSRMADMIMSKFYADATGMNYWDFKEGRTYRRYINFKDVIDKNIYFDSSELNSFLFSLKEKRIQVGKDKFEELLIYKGTGYTFATGGLHSVDRGDLFISNDKFIYIDFDFGSFYPNLMINLGIKPEHISFVFLKVLKNIVETRLKYKLEGDKVNSDILKIVVNAVFGKMGSLYSWLLDHKAMYKVTINGQLTLLQLIERLEVSGFHVISANTDGIITKVSKNRINEYKTICNSFSKEINIGGEFTEYIKYVRTGVNNYIAVGKDFVKSKNIFETKTKIDKAFVYPVVSKVLYEYYVNDNTDLKTLIKQYDIYDYCMSVNVGKQFITELHSIINSELKIEILQSNNRFFISNSGGVILKHNLNAGVNKAGKLKPKYTSIVSGHYATIFNKYYKSDNYNINYNWYLNKVLDIINQVNRELHVDSKKKSGNLFNI